MSRNEQAIERAKGKAIKAVLDARHVPFDLFGQGHAAHVRKLIYLYLATYADPDGTEAYPALTTIAKDCGLTVRGLSNILVWLSEHGLIAVEYKASHLGTNRYSVLLSEEALEAARLKLENDEDQATLRAKSATTQQARSHAARVRWAKKKGGADLEHSVPGATIDWLSDVERNVPGDMEHSVLGDMEHSVPGVPGTVCMGPGTQRSTNRPLNRPSDRPEREHAADAAAPKNKTASLPADAAADAALIEGQQWIDLQLAMNGWPITRQTVQIVRAHLSCGHSKERVFQAIKSTMKSMPERERQPGLYLGQNLKANLDLLIAQAKGTVAPKPHGGIRILEDPF
jgi:Helix-turn-helix domain